MHLDLTPLVHLHAESDVVSVAEHGILTGAQAGHLHREPWPSCVQLHKSAEN